MLMFICVSARHMSCFLSHAGWNTSVHPSHAAEWWLCFAALKTVAGDGNMQWTLEWQQRGTPHAHYEEVVARV